MSLKDTFIRKKQIVFEKVKKEAKKFWEDLHEM